MPNGYGPNMQTKEVSKATPHARVEEKIVSTTIREITPFGIRLEFNLAGSVSGELYSGNHIETLSLFQKTDGTFEAEAKAIESTKDGDVFVHSYSGKGRLTGPTTGHAEGEGIVVTQSKKFSQLNNARLRLEVDVDNATGDTVVKQYLV